MINSNWILMTEQLPPIDQDVLVYTPFGGMGVWSRNDTIYDTKFWKTECGFCIGKHNVIAWMDLPDPPKK